MADTFETFIANERTRLRAEREKLVASKSDIDAKIEALDTELSAITAYEEVKLGKPAATRAPRATGGVRNTGIRRIVLSRVKVAEKGLTAAELIMLVNPSDEAGKTSVRNAIAALKRSGQVDLKDGKYIAR